MGLGGGGRGQRVPPKRCLDATVGAEVKAPLSLVGAGWEKGPHETLKQLHPFSG